MSEHDPKKLQATLETAARPLNIDLTFKPMFGGIMGYTQGRVFASLSNVGVALKLSPDDQHALLEHEDAEYLRYYDEAPASKQYVKLPAAWIGQDDQLAPWLRKSAEYVMAQPAPKKRPAKKGEV